MNTKTRLDLKVVDADGHYLEPLFDLPSYIEPKYRDVAPRIVKREDGFEYWEGRACTAPVHIWTVPILLRSLV